jgi:hypothetical protein
VLEDLHRQPQGSSRHADSYRQLWFGEPLAGTPLPSENQLAQSKRSAKHLRRGPSSARSAMLSDRDTSGVTCHATW